MLVLLLASAVRASTETRDALDRIDEIGVPNAPPPTTAHAEVHDLWPLVIFFAPALAVAAAMGVAGSVVGTFVLLREEGLVALTLPHAVAVGAAVGWSLDVPVLPPALLALGGTLIAFSLEKRRIARRPGPSAVPAVYVAALCTSFLIVAHGGRHVEELQNLFTGIDVAVTPATAWGVAPSLLACGVVTGLFWRRWLLLAQSPAAAELAGVSTVRWHGGFLAMLAVYVLFGTIAQGVVMVVAMLFLPPAIVSPWARRLPGALVGGIAVALLMLGGAFVLSNTYALPLSHSVGGCGLVLLVASRTGVVVRG
ncbi:MAG TPA: metal ABC transporter permease [Tepidisphaeraceae bacterium]|jgi:ABC-type Mn2+/Zn2+ transport system permease subunit